PHTPPLYTLSLHDALPILTSLDRVLDSGAVQIHLDHVTAGSLQGLLDSGRHFTRLATAKTYLTFAIAHHSQRGKSKNTTAFYYFGNAVHLNQLFLQTFVGINLRHNQYP